MKNQQLFKILLYILSLWLLFMSLSIMSFDLGFIKRLFTALIDPDIDFPKETFQVRNLVFLVSIFSMLLGFLIFFLFEYSLSGGWSVACSIKDVENESHEHLEFLTTYIMPLVFTDVNAKRTVLNLFLMILVIGIIYIKTNRFYSNPSLAILGFRLYRLTILDRGECSCIAICHGELTPSDKIKYIKIDENTFFIKKI
ncbi:anti-phage protein KwaA [Aeromonas hydrophila]|uniref:anti-phage protein KwaA n=1 Tax=Aeromonas hydrophila TaxID=644 RepID=UPI002B498A17|nr:anti-phage protein KwaA [Aeromonas hydrophila]